MNYIENQTKDNTISLITYYYGKRENTRHHSYHGIKDHFLIIYVTNGATSMEIDGKNVSVKTGDLIFVFPFTRLCYQADCWSIQWLGLNGANISSFLKQIGITKEHPIFSNTNEMHISDIFDKGLALAEKNTLYCSLSVQAESYHLFSALLAASKPVRQITMEDIFTYIEHHFSNGIRIAELADYFHMDRSYLSRLVKKQTGSSLKSHIIHYQINYACDLLANTDLPIGEIACSCGILDIYYFSKLFRSKKGMTPTEYRSHVTASR